MTFAQGLGDRRFKDLLVATLGEKEAPKKPI